MSRLNRINFCRIALNNPYSNPAQIRLTRESVGVLQLKFDIREAQDMGDSRRHLEVEILSQLNKNMRMRNADCLTSTPHGN